MAILLRRVYRCVTVGLVTLRRLPSRVCESAECLFAFRTLMTLLLVAFMRPRLMLVRSLLGQLRLSRGILLMTLVETVVIRFASGSSPTPFRLMKSTSVLRRVI